MTQLEIRDIAAQSAAAEHAVTSADELPAVVDRAFPAIFARLGELGVQPAGPPFIRYLDTGDPMQVELGVPVASEFEDSEQVSLPAGRAAVWTHVGPYSELRHACEQLGAAVQELGEQPSGPFWESYVTNPAEEPDASKRVTEIYLPLR